MFLKDLSLLGRDIKKCIIVDNSAENFQMHPENGIFIKSWYGDLQDQALVKLAPILRGSPTLSQKSHLLSAVISESDSRE